MNKYKKNEKIPETPALKFSHFMLYTTIWVLAVVATRTPRHKDRAKRVYDSSLLQGP